MHERATSLLDILMVGRLICRQQGVQSCIRERSEAVYPLWGVPYPTEVLSHKGVQPKFVGGRRLTVMDLLRTSHDVAALRWRSNYLV